MASMMLSFAKGVGIKSLLSFPTPSSLTTLPQMYSPCKNQLPTDFPSVLHLSISGEKHKLSGFTQADTQHCLPTIPPFLSMSIPLRTATANTSPSCPLRPPVSSMMTPLTRQLVTLSHLSHTHTHTHTHKAAFRQKLCLPSF